MQQFAEFITLRYQTDAVSLLGTRFYLILTFMNI